MIYNTYDINFISVSIYGSYRKISKKKGYRFLDHPVQLQPKQ